MTPRFAPKGRDLILIALIAIAFYAPTIDNYWVKDDLLIGNFTDGDSAELSPRMVRHYLWPTTMQREQFWRPVAMLFGFADYLLWGVHPAGYHVGNVLLHALNAVLAALFFGRLTNFAHRAIPFVGALGFALSAIHTESVAWALQRMVLLCTTFSLLALLVWLREAEADRSGVRPAGLIFFGLALLSKEIAIVLPGIFVTIDLAYGRGPLLHRFRKACVRALAPAAMIAAFMACRYALWGRFDLKYAGMDPWEYARHNQVFENLGASFQHCLAPVNTTLFGDTWYRIFVGAFALSAGLALVRGVTVAIRRPEFRRAAFVLLSLAALVLLPTLLAFRVRDDLFNGRFFYLPGLALSGLLAAALWMPRRDDDAAPPPQSPATASPRQLALAASVLWLLASGWTLAAQLRAWDDGSTVIRRVQTAILDFAETRRGSSREVVVVAFNVPITRRGVPLIETHLDRTLRPPLGRPGVRGIPLLDTLRRRSPKNWPDTVERFRDENGLAWEDFRYVFCEFDPPGITPAFPSDALVPGQPDDRLNSPLVGPVEPLAPPDGIMLRSTAPAPTFVFRALPTVSHYRLHARVEDIGLLTFDLKESVNLERDGDRLRFDLNRGDPSRPELNGLWEKALSGPLDRPARIRWTIEALAPGTDHGPLSATRRMVVLNDRN